MTAAVSVPSRGMSITPFSARTAIVSFVWSQSTKAVRAPVAVRAIDSSSSTVPDMVGVPESWAARFRNCRISGSRQ